MKSLGGFLVLAGGGVILWLLWKYLGSAASAKKILPGPVDDGIPWNGVNPYPGATTAHAGIDKNATYATNFHGTGPSGPPGSVPNVVVPAGCPVGVWCTPDGKPLAGLPAGVTTASTAPPPVEFDGETHYGVVQSDGRVQALY